MTHSNGVCPGPGQADAHVYDRSMDDLSYETNFTALPHRMRRRDEPEPDGHYRWDVEYDQTEKGDWGPRGVIDEVDGAFVVRGERFTSPDRALLRFSRG